MRQVCALGVLLHALAARAAPPGPSDRWSLVLSDDFDSFNASRWTKGWTWCDGHGHLRPQRVHKKAGDACYFADENVWVEDGRLVLENRHERRGGYNYTSGVVNTGPSFQTLYGYFEARILASPPSGAPGACPAFWLPNTINDGDNGVGEIDVMEIPGGPHSGAGKVVWFTVQSAPRRHSLRSGALPPAVTSTGFRQQPGRVHWSRPISRRSMPPPPPPPSPRAARAAVAAPLGGASRPCELTL